MAQHFLDPRNIEGDHPKSDGVPAAIPRLVRKLGHLPPISRLLPGDLILVSPIKPTSVQKRIQSTQEAGGYHENDARWTHAAVYLGVGFSLCEATGEGVHHGSLLDSVASYLVRVRRDPRLDSDSRWRIALSASLQIGTSYGFWSAAKIFVRSRRGLHLPQNSPTQSGSKLICSELYADAYLSATGRTIIFQHPGREVSPAFLSFVPELQDVRMSWCKIPAE